LVVATGLHALRQGPKETIEQYLLCAKKLRDELEPYPEWHIVIGQLKSDIFAGLHPEFMKYITAINNMISQYDLLCIMAYLIAKEQLINLSKSNSNLAPVAFHAAGLEQGGECGCSGG
jgi:hypothetical protein